MLQLCSFYSVQVLKTIGGSGNLAVVHADYTSEPSSYCTCSNVWVGKDTAVADLGGNVWGGGGEEANSCTSEIKP